MIGEKCQDNLPEIPAEQPQTNNIIESTAFGELNTELDEYEQSSENTTYVFGDLPSLVT